MNIISKTLMCASIALAAGSSFAQDTMQKNEPMTNQGVMKKNMTLQECKDYMAAAKNDGMKKDDAMMHSDAMCAKMMKKHGTSHKRGTGTGSSMDRTGAGTGAGADTDRSGAGTGTSTDRSSTDRTGNGMGTGTDTGTGTDKQRSSTGSQSTMPK